MCNLEEIPERQESDPPPEFGRSTRRSFLSRLGLASLVATTGTGCNNVGVAFRKNDEPTFGRIEGRHSRSRFV